MKLLVKFNLIYVVVIAVGVGACSLIARNIRRACAEPADRV